MIQHTARAANRHEFGDRLNRPDLSVRRFDGNELRIWPDRIPQRGGIDEAFAIRREKGELHTTLLQPAGGHQHRLVLHGRGDEVIAGDQKIESDVVRLRRPSGEVELVRLHPKESGDGDSRVFQRVRRPTSVVVRERSGISKGLGEERRHRFDHPRIARRRRVMVEINRRFRHG